jgi:hypothetical protein
MTSFVTYVPAQQDDLRGVHPISEPPSSRQIFHLLQRDPVHLNNIAVMEFGGRAYHVAAFGIETKEDGHDPHLEHVIFQKSQIAAILRDDPDGPTIYGPLVLVFSTTKAFVEKTVNNVLLQDGNKPIIADESTRVYVIRCTDSNGIRTIAATNNEPVRYSKAKALKVAEAMTRDDAKRGISHNVYEVVPYVAQTFINSKVA